jgi:hypothetical protein
MDDNSRHRKGAKVKNEDARFLFIFSFASFLFLFAFAMTSLAPRP